MSDVFRGVVQPDKLIHSIPPPKKTSFLYFIRLKQYLKILGTEQNRWGKKSLTEIQMLSFFSIYKSWISKYAAKDINKITIKLRRVYIKNICYCLSHSRAVPHHSHEREKVPRILVSHIWYANTHSIWHIPNTQEQVSSKQGKVLVIRVSSFVAPQAAKGENYMVWENRGSLSTETQNTHTALVLKC